MLVWIIGNLNIEAAATSLTAGLPVGAKLYLRNFESSFYP
jgi:hypothetical protein